MQLRPYQEGALNALRQSLRDGTKRPLVCLPTGSGKSPVIAHLLHKLSERYPDERFVCTVHTQELVEQLAKTYQVVSGCCPAVYSASLRRKELGRVVFAQIQSIYKKACDIGRVKLLVVDECDRIPMEGDGQYRTFIKECEVIAPDLRICGFTATPYRMRGGLVFGPERPFNDMVFDAGIRELINAGWLTKLVSKDGGRPDLSGISIRNGDYVASELDECMSSAVKVDAAVNELVRYGADRRAWLVFCSGVKHANMVHEALGKKGINGTIIEGNTPDGIRRTAIEAYRNRELRCLINVNVLSVGFDAPHVDLLCLLRPTKSPGLYYQQVGRGLRVADGKENCLVLDLAGNINEHGPIDTLNDRIQRTKSAKEKGVAPVKTCERCREIVHAGLRRCPVCGFEFPAPEIAKHGTIATATSPLAETKKITITDVKYSVHMPKDPSKKPTLMVQYYSNFVVVAREWVSVDSQSHPWAHQRAMLWLHDTPKAIVDGRSLTIGSGKITGHTTDGEVEIATAQGMLPFTPCLANPIVIEVRPQKTNPKYVEVVGRTFAAREAVSA